MEVYTTLHANYTAALEKARRHRLLQPSVCHYLKLLTDATKEGSWEEGEGRGKSISW